MPNPLTIQRSTRHRGPSALRSFALVELTILVTFTALVAPAAAHRGYQPRACGFDMNRNGISGEPQDCHVCDGATTDPDFDGVAEDLIYVDAHAGADTSTCGTPVTPCRSIAYAWGARADGPADGAEDIVCIRGTFAAEQPISPGVGVAGTYSVAASGSQARPWEYPKNPAMLVGWDHDGDGEYPPYDTDDVAVLGGTGATARAFELGNSRVEIAHLTIAGGSYTGAFRFQSGHTVTHAYIHDIETAGINRDKPAHSDVSWVSIFAGMQNHVQFSNIRATDTGAHFARGAGANGGPDKGPLRFSNLSVTAHSCDATSCGDLASTIGFKLWGYVSGVEVLDSLFDANVRSWNPWTTNPAGALFAIPAQCVQDWTLRNNELIDYKIAMYVQPYAGGYCDGAAARPVTGIVFDRNLFRNTYQAWSSTGNHAVYIQEGQSLNSTTGDITVSNNFFFSPVGIQSVISSAAGNNEGPQTGLIRMVNNTAYVSLDAASWGAVTVATATAFPQHDYEVKNNVITGVAADREVFRVTYAPARWASGL
jgi:hypothetical protein